MNLDSAKQGGGLAASIDARIAKIASIKDALNSGFRISVLRATGPDGQDLNIILETLDVSTSAQCLQFALQIYQTQLDALNAELAVL